MMFNILNVFPEVQWIVLKHITMVMYKMAGIKK